MTELITLFGDELAQTILLAIGGALIWRVKVSGRLDTIDKELGSAEKSRERLYIAQGEMREEFSKSVRHLERRLDLAKIPEVHTE